MHASESDRCRRLVNPDQRGGFGLRNLVASVTLAASCASYLQLSPTLLVATTLLLQDKATVQNESMDQRQVERAQKKLDSEYAGSGVPVC